VAAWSSGRERATAAARVRFDVEAIQRIEQRVPAKFEYPQGSETGGNPDRADHLHQVVGKGHLLDLHRDLLPRRVAVLVRRFHRPKRLRVPDHPRKTPGRIIGLEEAAAEEVEAEEQLNSTRLPGLLRPKTRRA